MKSTTANDMQELLNFSIEDDFVVAKNKQVYFYRFSPPNLSILTQHEKQLEFEKLCLFLESINIPLQIFAMDKVEDLSKNKVFFANNMLDEYKEYTEQIVNQLSSYEASDEQTNSIQRAYYFVIKIKDKGEKGIFDEAIQTQRLKCYQIQKQELITVFRNFLIREFSSFDFYVFNKEVLENNGRK